jgi:hypothetical protein
MLSRYIERGFVRESRRIVAQTHRSALALATAAAATDPGAPHRLTIALAEAL